MKVTFKTLQTQRGHNIAQLSVWVYENVSDPKSLGPLIKEELINMINEASERSTSEESKILRDDLVDYLNSEEKDINHPDNLTWETKPVYPVEDTEDKITEIKNDLDVDGSSDFNNKFVTPLHYPGSDKNDDYIAYLAKTQGNEYSINFCIGNVGKYLTRIDRKGVALQDIAKINVYFKRAIEMYFKDSSGDYDIEFENRYIENIKYIGREAKTDKEAYSVIKALIHTQMFTLDNDMVYGWIKLKILIEELTLLVKRIYEEA